VLSLVGGFIGIENIYHAQRFSGVGEHQVMSLVQQLVAPLHAPVAAVLGLLAAGVGFAGAYALYSKGSTDPLPARLGAISKAMRNRFYVDELYEGTVIRFHELLSGIAGWIDRWIIAGLLVRGTHGTTELMGRALRLAQTGNLQTYAILFALGVALVMYLALK
jgi:NADH-quinone oxidoreductase subunit L